MKLDYTQHYAKFHTDAPGHRRGLTLLHRRLLAPQLPADRSAPILDVGCGRGYALQDVGALGYTALRGVDPDAGQVAFARGLSLDVEHVASAQNFLSDKPGAFAAILLMDVLEHVPRAEQPDFLRALARSLRPGGRLICTVPNAATAIGGYWRYNDYTHECAFTSDSLSFLLGQTGFATVQCHPVEFFPRPRFLFWVPTPRTFAWLSRCLSRLRRRVDYVGELGWARGLSVILTPNLLAVADVPSRA